MSMFKNVHYKNQYTIQKLKNVSKLKIEKAKVFILQGEKIRCTI